MPKQPTNDWRVKFEQLYGDDFDGGCRDKYIDFITEQIRQAVADTLNKLDPTPWNKPSDATKIGWDYCEDEIKRRCEEIKKEYKL